MLRITFLIILMIAFGIQPARSQIVLSEVMFDPVGADYYDEFIEIFNLSYSDTVDLNGWKISDGSDVDQIVSVQHGLELPPRRFGIILDSGYFGNSSRYDQLIPSDALIVTIDDAAFGSNGLTNTSPKPIILISNRGDTVAYYIYSVDNPPGYSDEKINLAGSDSSGNWANSKVLNGTPGSPNSVSQLDHNIKVALQASPAEAPPAHPITLIASVTNLGHQPASDITLTFFEDLNGDSSASLDEQLGEQIFVLIALQKNEFHQTTLMLDSLSSGIHNFLVYAKFSLDQDTTDNWSTTMVKIGFRPRQIVINEIMYRPAGQQPEWFEIFNPTEQPINLKEWQFSDANINQKFRLSDSNLSIASAGFVIVAESAILKQYYSKITSPVIIPTHGWPALNNNGDAVYLYDPIGTVVDQVSYSPSWGNEPGISLERKDPSGNSDDPSNWGQSQHSEGATPGMENSIAPAAFDLELSTIQFVPSAIHAQEPISIIASIVNVGRNTVSHFQLLCFIDLNHNEVFQEDERIGDPIDVFQPLASKQSTSLSFPFIAPMAGRYACSATIFAEQDSRPANNSATTVLSVGFNAGDLVINEIMYSPRPGQPEWVELFNPSSKTIDIQCWSITDSDSATKITIAPRYYPISPQSFVVISADSSLLNYFDLNQSPLIVIKSLPRLNDDMDQIFIYDANKNIIDAVSYRGSWGGEKGVSLERINPLLASNDSSNWSSCVVLSQGGTPGRRNSVFVDILPSEAELTIAPDPFSPDGDGRDDVTIITYQLPFNLSRIHIRIFDIRGRLVRFLVNNQPSGTASSFIWDGRDDHGHLCRMGIYIVYLEAIHYQRGVVKSLKKTVVLGQKL
ncbi:MAG: lamin tail domain-containing protein [candidate division KSB1 bacterium]|nr:lamin tail domain-containing protein [candidate division KSB1 bacterium]MDZ7399964.1 lamin tail domain-containing protein [candidate division KSB1 bacterium]